MGKPHQKRSVFLQVLVLAATGFFHVYATEEPGGGGGGGDHEGEGQEVLLERK